MLVDDAVGSASPRHYTREAKPARRRRLARYRRGRHGVATDVSEAMRDFRELKVWEKAHRLALEVYRETEHFPGEERFGLSAQLRRSAVSVSSNIAEGCGRGGKRELAQFLNIAAGSASELEYQLLLARDLEHLSTSRHRELDAEVNEVKRMLNSFIQRLTGC